MFRTLVLIGLGVTVVAVLAHYVLFGPKRVSGGKAPRSVKRFSFWERLIHVVTVLAFLVLAGTGLIAVVGLGSPLHGWLWLIHVGAAPVFGFALTLLVIMWAQEGRFAPYDWEWVKQSGGYLWGSEHPPAERINAGQKAYLWSVGVLALIVIVTGLGRAFPMLDPATQDALYQVHRYGALLFMMVGLVHLYLGTLANPGTLGAMLTGKVTAEWAQKHHPLWWDRIKGGSKKSK